MKNLKFRKNEKFGCDVWGVTYLQHKVFDDVR